MSVLSVQVLQGDCREHLARLVAEGVKVHAVITDPPYHLTSGKATKTGFMNKTWDGGNIAFDPDTWRRVFDVMLPGAHLAAFGGTRGWHRMACAIEDAGFDIRDQIASLSDGGLNGPLFWCFGTGFPKSHNVGKGINAHLGAEPRDPLLPEALPWEGWGTALKPAWEPIILARRPLDGTVGRNVLTHGCGGLNIDASRVETAEGENFTRPAVYNGEHEGWQRPWKSEPEALERRQSAKDVSAEKAQTLGRFPANLVHDGSDEVEAAFAAFVTGPEKVSRFFTSLKNDNLLPSSAKAILEECLSKFANDAQSSSMLSEAVCVSVLTHAVILASRGEIQLSGCQGLGETGTATSMMPLFESVIIAIRSIAGSAWQELQPERHFQTDSRASVVIATKATGTTTITTSRWKSDGSAAPVTCSIMPTLIPIGEQSGVSNRFYYSAKANKSDRAGSAHPTVKPTSLCRWLVQLITPPGGTVLDPFAGSGSTGLAATQLGMNSILIEQDAEYVADIHRKLASAPPMPAPAKPSPRAKAKPPAPPVFVPAVAPSARSVRLPQQPDMFGGL